MTWHSRYTVSTQGKVAIITVGVLLIYGELFARDIIGRAIISYQESTTPAVFQETLFQRYQATLRERLFERSQMEFTFFFDDAKNMSDDRTLRRYRFQLDLNHPYYTFNGRWIPKQTFTPLELDDSREVDDDRIGLDIHVPNWPTLRLYYGNRKVYENNVFSGTARDLRGDLEYSYKFLLVGVNRWQIKNENSSTNNTNISGGIVQLSKTFSNVLNTLAGYDVQYTENERNLGIPSTILNQRFRGLISAHYKRVFTGTFSAQTRRLKNTSLTSATNINDTAIMQLNFFPTDPLSIDVFWNYQSTKQEANRILSNFGTVQGVLKGEIRPKTFARLQASKRIPFEQENGVIPSDILFLSIRSQIYWGIDSRLEWAVSKRNDDTSPGRRYQVTTLLDFFLVPRPSLLITPNLQYFKFSEDFSLLNNNRRSYGVRVNYSPRSMLNVGFDWRRNETRAPVVRNDMSYVINAALRFRNRANMTISYGQNQIDDQSDLPQEEEVSLDSRATTLNFQAQVWLSQRSSLSANYSSVTRDDGNDNEFLSVTFRVDF